MEIFGPGAGRLSVQAQRDPSHGGEATERECQGEVLQVVGAAAPKNDSSAGREIGPPPAGGCDGFPPGQPGAGG